MSAGIRHPRTQFTAHAEEAHNLGGVLSMKPVVITVTLAMLSAALFAQEKKPVPKDSVRVSIPGCTKGYIFTAGRRTADQPGSVDIPEGMHLRLNGPKTITQE